MEAIDTATELQALRLEHKRMAKLYYKKDENKWNEYVRSFARREERLLNRLNAERHNKKA